MQLQSKDTKKADRLAKTSFILSIALIPLVLVCSIIPRVAFHNDPLMIIARLSMPVNVFLIPLSFILGIAGLVHILIKRKKYYGYWMSFVGIGLSTILFITLFYNVFVVMGEHMW